MSAGAMHDLTVTGVGATVARKPPKKMQTLSEAARNEDDVFKECAAQNLRAPLSVDGYKKVWNAFGQWTMQNLRQKKVLILYPLPFKPPLTKRRMQGVHIKGVITIVVSLQDASGRPIATSHGHPLVDVVAVFDPVWLGQVGQQAARVYATMVLTTACSTGCRSRPASASRTRRTR